MNEKVAQVATTLIKHDVPEELKGGSIGREERLSPKTASIPIRTTPYKATCRLERIGGCIYAFSGFRGR